MAKTTKKEIKKEVVEQLCTCCGETKRLNGAYFYKSYSVIFKNNIENRMTVCKECVIKLAGQFKTTFANETKGLYELCRLLDVYYEKNLFDSCKSQAESKKSNPYQIYFQKSSSLPQYRDKTFIDSALTDLSKEDGIVDSYAEDVARWGNFPASDIVFLNSEYSDMINRYECDSYAQEILFQQICFQRLDIKKKRENGSSVDKELKTLQDLLGSANIKPVQESGALASEQVTFGTLIKKFENEKPIPEPLKEWKDSDWIKKYVSTWFFGHFSKMMGIKNDNSKEYDEALNQYTVKVERDDEE